MVSTTYATVRPVLYLERQYNALSFRIYAKPPKTRVYRCVTAVGARGFLFTCHTGCGLS